MNRIFHPKSIFLCAFIFVFGVGNLMACMCGKPSVCEAYNVAKAIVVAKVVDVKEAQVSLDTIFEKGNPNEFELGHEVTLEVSKWFKGKAQKIIKLSQPGSSCDWKFNSEDFNKTYLFYLDFIVKYQKYRISACGRSAELKKANEDLSYLNGLPNSLERTRISGTIEHYEGSGYDFRFIDYLFGIKVNISGENKSYTVSTDKNGMYEIWDLPLGKYKISPEIPKGYKMRFSIENGLFEYKEIKETNEVDPNQSRLVIKKRGCGGRDFVVDKKD